jgi:hypothetical protein
LNDLNKKWLLRQCKFQQKPDFFQIFPFFIAVTNKIALAPARREGYFALLSPSGEQHI